MESDVKESMKSESSWRVEEEDEEMYNFSDEKGVWQPKPEDILSMFDQLSKGGTLSLQWTCPGRRPPESELDANNTEETEMQVDKEELEEEQSREPEPCAFDFDDTSSEIGIKTIPMRTLGGTVRTPRTEKRVARMDNIMDSLRKQQIQRAAEREARRAKASPRTPQGRGGRLLKFSNSPLGHTSNNSNGFENKTKAPVCAIVPTSETSKSQSNSPAASTTGCNALTPPTFGEVTTSVSAISTSNVNNFESNSAVNVNTETAEKGKCLETEESKSNNTCQDVNTGLPVTSSLLSQPAPETSIPTTASTVVPTSLPHHATDQQIAVSSSTSMSSSVLDINNTSTIPSIHTDTVSSTSSFTTLDSSASLTSQSVNIHTTKLEITSSHTVLPASSTVTLSQTQNVTEQSLVSTNNSSSEQLTKMSIQSTQHKSGTSVSEPLGVQENKESSNSNVEESLG